MLSKSLLQSIIQRTKTLPAILNTKPVQAEDVKAALKGVENLAGKKYPQKQGDLYQLYRSRETCNVDKRPLCKIRQDDENWVHVYAQDVLNATTIMSTVKYTTPEEMADDLSRVSGLLALYRECAVAKTAATAATAATAVAADPTAAAAPGCCSQAELNAVLAELAAARACLEETSAQHSTLLTALQAQHATEKQDITSGHVAELAALRCQQASDRSAHERLVADMQLKIDKAELLHKSATEQLQKVQDDHVPVLREAEQERDAAVASLYRKMVEMTEMSKNAAEAEQRLNRSENRLRLEEERAAQLIYDLTKAVTQNESLKRQLEDETRNVFGKIDILKKMTEKHRTLKKEQEDEVEALQQRIRRHEKENSDLRARLVFAERPRKMPRH